MRQSSFLLNVLGRPNRRTKERYDKNNADDDSAVDANVVSLPIWRTITSIGSIIFIGTIVVSVVDWNTKQKLEQNRFTKKYNQQTKQTTTSTSSTGSYHITQQEQPKYRRLDEYNTNSDNPNNNNKDNTEDETCRKYLVNFLNGTTDYKDECQGFYKAWVDADCPTTNSNNKQHPNNLNLGRKHTTTNGTVVDDDIAIDDAYENIQCCSVISSFYEKHCTNEGTSVMDLSKLLSIITVLLVCGIVKSLLRYANIQFVPDAGACIVVGIFVAFLIKLLYGTPIDDKDKLSFDNDLFLRIMLPPIIFEAALTIDKRSFRRDIFPIVMFSTVGTALSALIVGYSTYYMSNNIWKRGVALPFLDCMLFGSLMSSIDPVATLSILAGVGVRQTDPLYILIFGESLLNDGVAIVLFDSLIEHMGDVDAVGSASVYDTLGDFFIITGGSMLIGYIAGIGATIYFWLLHRKQNAVTEVALFFAWALIPYYVADGLKYSGIIAIMVMGFMMDYYIIGGFQSDNSQWIEYMEMRCNNNNIANGNGIMTSPINNGGGDANDYNNQQQLQFGAAPVEPYFDKLQMIWYKAFSGRGHLLKRSQHHIGFVAEVITAVMETAIFAYLGLFLFHDRDFNFKLMTSGLFSCILSRAGMVIILSLLINVCVFVDLEIILGQLWNKVWTVFRQLSNTTTVGSRSNFLSNNEDDDDDNTTRYRMNNNNAGRKQYLNTKTQMILFSAGIRGAVSYALVQNIPVYDAVTKTGSHYKGELRTMTSVTIIALLFGFGAVTYFIVNSDDSITRSTLGDDDDNDGDNNNNYHERLLPQRMDGTTTNNNGGGMIVQHHYQLMNSGLASSSDGFGGSTDDDATMNSLLFAVSNEEQQRRRNNNPIVVDRPYEAPPMGNLLAQQQQQQQQVPSMQQPEQQYQQQLQGVVPNQPPQHLFPPSQQYNNDSPSFLTSSTQ